MVCAWHVLLKLFAELPWRESTLLLSKLIVFLATERCAYGYLFRSIFS